MALRPRILVCSTQMTPPSYWGGSEKHWYEILLHPEFARRFEAAAVLRKTEATVPCGAKMRRAGVKMFWWPLVSQKWYRRLKLRVRELLTRQGGDDKILHAVQTFRPQLVWVSASNLVEIVHFGKSFKQFRERNIPYWIVVQQAAEQCFFWNDSAVDRAAEILRGAARIVCVSQKNAEAVERSIAEKCPNIWRSANTVSDDFASKAAALPGARAEGRARFLCLGRFYPANKGQHLLFETLAGPAWKTRDWVLRLQGEGMHERLVKKYMKFYGLPKERVIFSAQNEGVLDILADTDLLLMPSLAEGMPFVLIEAMAAGLPAVGTPVAGIPELITDGETGWLASSVSAGAFAEALERAWAARARWPETGRAARRHVLQRFTHKAVLPAFFDALEKDARA
jgi:glycosyltransferase involved in cell wall biosynthesis